MAEATHKEGLLAPAQLFQWTPPDGVTLHERTIRVRTEAEPLELSRVRRADSEEPLFSLYPVIPRRQFEVQGFRCQHG